ncbi:hypothetical protein NHX12_027303 [Muraenolepis orangiensis]|uniref:Uncharacterized protein n=1 Tax=Muraenolepis orangiensis TaxID=630683 RepID=A0A9Q0EGN4_9TELE|nr:hypothetical protein NHX12_027303 [Muraenolepis orangiensis]
MPLPHPLSRCHPSSPVESSRFGSSGNLSQVSSQLSEMGQESTGGSELEESFHSYHSPGFRPPSFSSTGGPPPANGLHHPTNGHSPQGVEAVLRTSAKDLAQGLSSSTVTETPADRRLTKFLGYEKSLIKKFDYNVNLN